VAISSLADMEALFDQFRSADVTTSMTINSPAAAIWAMYLAVAEKQGADWKAISGTLQNDILKEYIAQKEYIYPPEPSMRLVIDTIEFGAERTPKFNPISISGYHIREAGSTAIQELAFTLRDGIEYVERGLRARLGGGRIRAAAFVFLQRAQRFLRGDRQISRRAAHLAQSDARAFRREESALLGAALPHADGGLLADRAAALQQRGAHGHASAGRGAGRHAIAAHQFARRSLGAAHRSAATSRCARSRSSPRKRRHEYRRPFGGSYFVETLTNEIERGAWDYIAKIDALGGMVSAIERGYPQREIADAAYRYQMEVDRKEKIIVGVNDYVSEESPSRFCRSTSRCRAAIGTPAPAARRALARSTQVDAAACGCCAKRRAKAPRCNLMPYTLRRRKILRHARRNLRSAARGLRHLRRSGDHLAVVICAYRR
jgi:methylmalonyl-CoA mutase N-terminal domain/subunit